MYFGHFTYIDNFYGKIILQTSITNSFYGISYLLSTTLAISETQRPFLQTKEMIKMTAFCFNLYFSDLANWACS